MLAALRDSDAASQVSTVDVTDTAAGRVVVALALAREAEGQSGSWGTSRSADGPLPGRAEAPHRGARMPDTCVESSERPEC